jgi:hypothetical protein
MSMPTIKVSRLSAMVSREKAPFERLRADAAPENGEGETLALPEAVPRPAAGAVVEAAPTAPVGVIVMVVVYELVTGEVGSTSVALSLARVEPKMVVVAFPGAGMMMVIELKALPETVV